jgi:FkbM family methyltransferase
VNDALPFGAHAPRAGWGRVIRFAQRAPQNLVGKQLARLARDFYLRRAPLPVDVSVGDMRLRCQLDDNTCERKFVFTPWRFDPLERSALAASLPRDGVFVDIGANVGIYALSAALVLGPAGRVIAFEPFPAAYRRLVFNIDATRGQRPAWPQVQALDLGISDRDETRELRIDAGNLGGASIAGAARFASAESAATVRIRCKPLLQALDELAVQRIDVLKIDIEGAEDLALVPFLVNADEARLPRRMIVENSEALWKLDLRAALARRSYRATARTRLNTIWAR